MENSELLRHIFQLESKLFKKTEIFQIIELKAEKKCLIENERQQLRMEIQSVFINFIQTIKINCPEITDEDIIFCCLVKTGLNTSVISCCMGNADNKAANQRKYRIKKKIMKAKCDSLFDQIFNCT
jgi:hypothetical protein